MPRISSKTKAKLIDVARKLFAQKGIEKTTMNDIAEESTFGRRTLYTYFKSKNDLVKAIIESELQTLYQSIESLGDEGLSPDEKLIRLTFVRLSALRETVRRNGNLRAEFFKDIWRVEMVRKEFDRKEIAYLESILYEGCEQDIFTIHDVPRTAIVLHFALKGLEVPFFRGLLPLDYNSEDDRKLISNIVFKGLEYKSEA